MFEDGGNPHLVSGMGSIYFDVADQSLSKKLENRRELVKFIIIGLMEEMSKSYAEGVGVVQQFSESGHPVVIREGNIDFPNTRMEGATGWC